MKDIYAELGVAKDATQADIKKAYRRKARELHPDTGGGDEEAFKRLGAAYEVLSDPQKRALYDQGIDPRSQGGAGHASGFGFEDIFESFFGGAQRSGPVSRRQRGSDTLVHLDITLAEATFGAPREVTIDRADTCDTCEGSCCTPGTEPRTCDNCGGAGVIQRVARSLLGQVMSTTPCPSCSGFGTIIESPCSECAGQGRTRARHSLDVDVPAGVETGTRIRLPGSGDAGTGGGPRGDLYVEVRQKAHESFERRGDDIHCTVQIPMTAAALGTVVTIDTLDGEREVDVRPGTQSGQTVKLKNLGVGHLQRSGRGDLYVHMDVETPTSLTEEQEDMIRALAGARGEDLREARLAPVNAGLLARLKDAFVGR